MESLDPDGTLLLELRTARVESASGEVDVLTASRARVLGSDSQQEAAGVAQEQGFDSGGGGSSINALLALTAEGVFPSIYDYIQLP